jgi:hypothetical protein
VPSLPNRPRDAAVTRNACGANVVLVGARRRNGCHRASSEERLVAEPYSWAAILLKVVLRFVPTRVKAAIAATAISAAINAYSMAVTPDSSLIRLERRVRKLILLG